MPTETAMRLIEERRQYTCEVFGCENPAEEAHHCFLGKRKGMKELDADENLELVCISCHKHTGKAKSFENKMHFWQIQCERYGWEHMRDWYASLPIKAKDVCYKKPDVL